MLLCISYRPAKQHFVYTSKARNLGVVYHNSLGQKIFFVNMRYVIPRYYIQNETVGFKVVKTNTCETRKIYICSFRLRMWPFSFGIFF